MIEARPSAHGVELAYVLRRSAWGHGYMTEAVRGVIDSALGDNSVFRVWAYVDTRNVASQRVLDRVGMIGEGTLHRWVVHPNVADEASDVFMYALRRSAPIQPRDIAPLSASVRGCHQEGRGSGYDACTG